MPAATTANTAANRAESALLARLSSAGLPSITPSLTRPPVAVASTASPPALHLRQHRITRQHCLTRQHRTTISEFENPTEA
jgi:hypothetical protein